MFGEHTKYSLIFPSNNIYYFVCSRTICLEIFYVTSIFTPCNFGISKIPFCELLPYLMVYLKDVSCYICTFYISFHFNLRFCDDEKLSTIHLSHLYLNKIENRKNEFLKSKVYKPCANHVRNVQTVFLLLDFPPIKHKSSAEIHQQNMYFSGQYVNWFHLLKVSGNSL